MQSILYQKHFSITKINFDQKIKKVPKFFTKINSIYTQTIIACFDTNC